MQDSHRKLPGISVIMCTTRENTIHSALHNFLHQDYPHKELIIILNKNSINLARYEEIAIKHDNIAVYQLDEEITLGACFEFGFHQAHFDYIAKFDDDDFYGEKYLSQVMQTFDTIQCDVVGKACYFLYFTESKKLALCRETEENSFPHHVSDATLAFKREVLENIQFPYLSGSGTFTDIQWQVIQKGFKIYSTDRYNFAVCRNPNPEKEHTWQVTEETFLSYPIVQMITENITDFRSYIEPS